MPLLLRQVINLVGPVSQQDVELTALYRDAVVTNGEGNVLGILATKTSDHEMRKRAAAVEEDPNASSTTTTTPIALIEPNLSEDVLQENFIYYPGEQSYKILLHTQSPPRIINGSLVTVLNDPKLTITTNQRNQNVKTMKVRYNSKPGQVRVRFSEKGSISEFCTLHLIFYSLLFSSFFSLSTRASSTCSTFRAVIGLWSESKSMVTIHFL